MGSGSSGNSYFLFTQTDGILIDAGISLRTLKKEFREYGLSLASVKNILVTHDHADHIKSVGNFSNDYNIPIYTTKGVHEGMQRNNRVSVKLKSENKRFIEKGIPFQLGEFNITPFEVPHDSTDNVGYRIECGGIIFCLMTDAGHVTDEMNRYIADSNYLVIEANHDPEMLANGPYAAYLKERISGPEGHLSNNDAAQALANNVTEKMRHVWLCHLSEENNHPELARKTVESVLRSYGIVCGTDFALDVLKRKTPSPIFDLI